MTITHQTWTITTTRIIEIRNVNVHVFETTIRASATGVEEPVRSCFSESRALQAHQQLVDDLTSNGDGAVVVDNWP